MKIFKLMLLVIVLVSSILFSSSTDAHSGGPSIEKIVGDYKIDLGYNTDKFRVAEPVSFDFILYRNEVEVVPFTDILVRISSAEQVVFSGSLDRPSFGLTTLNFTFPQAGEYEFSVRFENDDESIVETTFPLTVEAQNVVVTNSGKYKSSFLLLGLGAVVGFVTGLFMRKNTTVPKI